MTRNKVLEQAIEQCLKELYTYVTPSITWEEFKKENKLYNRKYKVWENFNKAFQEKDKNPEMWLQYQSTFKDWENKSIDECIGPKPFEFYYLPKKVLDNICDSYIYAYRIDEQRELLDTIETLKNYCREPIVEIYVEPEKGRTGYKDFEHSDSLERIINRYLDLEFPLMDPQRALDADDFDNKLEKASKELQDKFFEFLDMAGKFFRWDKDLNSFKMSVYLGPSPNSNKKAVIENWKKYRNKGIEINEEQIIKEYFYGEDYDE